MKKIFGCVALMLFATSSVFAATSQTFKHKFTKGEKLVYNVSVNIAQTTTVDPKGVAHKSSISSKMNLVMAIEVVDVKNAATLNITFTDLELLENMSTPMAGNNILTIKKGNVVLVRDGVTIIDSTKNIAKDLARLINAKYAFLGVTGTVELKPSGQIGKVSGKETFVAFFATHFKNTLFGFESPTEPTNESETYDGSEIEVKQISSVKLSAGGFVYKPKYTFTKLNGNIATISRKSILSEKELDGMAKSSAGADKVTHINYYDRSEGGEFSFDVERGKVISSKTTIESYKVDFSVKMEGDKSIPVLVKGSGSTSITLKTE